LSALPIFLLCVITALLHECGHIFYAERLGYRATHIQLMPYGAAAVLQIDGISPWDEVKLALSGPLVNALLCVVIVATWWFFPVTYAYTDTIFAVNLGMFLFNLLPAYPLDGGRIMRALFTALKIPKADLILRITTATLSVLFVVLFILYLNPSFLIAGLLLAVATFGKREHASRIQFKSYERLRRGVEVKYVMVNADITFRQALKLVEPSRYLVLQLYSGDFLEEITQDELYTNLQSHSLYDRVYSPDI
jgi:stage IV sporulation protein FB